MSFVDQHGEWESRKISIIGVAKSVISQLSIGQELTKVTLPSLFLSPYSALELAGYRCLQHIDLLLRANEEHDPVKRFLHVLRYFLSITQKEKFEKKPYNPILGENHLVWAEPENSKGPVVFLAEQVSHHPPVFAYIIESKNEKIKIRSTVNFATKFHGNSISIVVTGSTKIELGFHGEHYHINKPLPDLWIKNTIFGTKREPWDGEVGFTCPKTNLKCNLTFKEEGWSAVNHSTAILTKMDSTTPIVTIKGVVGDSYLFIKQEESSPYYDEKIFLDMKNLKENKMHYLPESEWDDRSSLKIWGDTSTSIAIDDMPNADISKRKIEDAQRKRRNENANFAAQFFKLAEDGSNFWDCALETIMPLINRKKDPLVSSLQEEDKLVQKLSNVEITDKETEKAASASPKVSKK